MGENCRNRGEPSAPLIMNIDEIRQLIDLANESGVAELEVQRGENRVRIRRAIPASSEYVIGSEPKFAHASSANPGAAALSAPSAPATPAENDLITVKSPIVGTFYESPSPDAEPFVSIGDTVKPGDVLCIIESMKLMNEIECEYAGVIVSLFVANSQPVEYGEPLMAIRPH